MKVEFWLAFILYFCVLFAVGFAVRKKKPSASDMLMGSRGLNFWVTALSAQASDMSSWLFMAFPMAVMVGGIPQIWLAVGLLFGMFATWHFIAPKLRVETERYNAYTLSTYFSKRFHDPKGVIRVLSSVMMLLFLTYYLAAGLISIGLLCESLFELNYYVGILIAATVILGYTFIGGFVSVAWVDLFQAIFLLLAIIIVPCMAFFQIDGWAAIFAAAENSKIPMTFFPENYKDILYPLFGWGLGYFGMPHIITKFMAIKDPKELTKSKYLGITWEACALIAATFVGIIGIAYFKNGIANPEFVFVNMVSNLFHPFTSGLVLCGVMAATISTMDSQILVAASSVTEDIYKQLINKNATSKKEVVAFRFAVVIFTLLALWIASYRNQTIMETVYYAWAGLGCTFAPLIISALYSKYVTRQGALAGVIAGGLLAAIWPMLNRYLAEAGILEATPTMIIGFPFGLAMIFSVSYLTKKRNFA